MRIVLSTERFYPPMGGADFSALVLFRELSKRHETSAIFTGESDRTGRVGKIRTKRIGMGIERNQSIGLLRIYLMNRKWEKVLDNYVKEGKPDLIITQGGLTPSSVKVAKRYGIPVAVFVRSFDYMCISAFIGVKGTERHNCMSHASIKHKIQYPIFKILAKWHEDAVKSADIVIANSKFTQSLIKKWYGVKSEVIYPFIRLEDYRTKVRRPEYITFVRPKVWKGVDVFLKIADALPDKEFLTVGRADKVSELLKRKNVKYMGWTNDMKDIYSRTKFLLVPSIWKEAFGRIAIEAMVGGVPCIVSNVGGLPETVEDAGIVIKDPYDLKAWTNAIKRLDKDKTLLSRLSKKSKTQARKFNFNKQYKRFERIINGLR